MQAGHEGGEEDHHGDDGDGAGRAATQRQHDQGRGRQDRDGAERDRDGKNRHRQKRRKRQQRGEAGAEGEARKVAGQDVDQRLAEGRHERRAVQGGVRRREEVGGHVGGALGEEGVEGEGLHQPVPEGEGKQDRRECQDKAAVARRGRAALRGRQDQRRRRGAEALPEPAERGIGEQGDGGRDRGDAPGRGHVERAHRLDGKDAEAALGAGEFAHYRAEQRGGCGNLEAGDEVGKGGGRPHFPQFRPAAAAVAADEVEPAGGCRAQADHQRQEGGVVDRERRECHLRSGAGPPQHAQDRAGGDERQAEDDERGEGEQALQPRQEQAGQRESRTHEVADQEAQRGGLERHGKRARHETGVRGEPLGDGNRTGEKEASLQRAGGKLPGQQRGKHAGRAAGGQGRGRAQGDREGHSAASGCAPA